MDLLEFISARKEDQYKLRNFNDPVIDMLDKENFEREMDRSSVPSKII
jgi:hypothetical protein